MSDEDASFGSDIPDEDGDEMLDDDGGSDGYDPGDDDSGMVQEFRRMSTVMIEEDLAHVRALFNNDADYFYDEAAEYFYIRLPIDTNFIDSFTAEAWSLNQEMPIIIEVQIGVQYLECSLPPKIRLFQYFGPLKTKKLVNERPSFGVLSWFLTNRLELAIQKNWKNNFKDTGAPRKHATPLNKSGGLNKSQNIDKEEWQCSACTLFNTGGTICAACDAPKPSNVSPAVEKLVHMGFSVPMAKAALSQANDNLELAAGMLLEGTVVVNAEPSKPNPAAQVHVAEVPINKPASDNFFETGNFLEGLVRYVTYRTATCTRSCVICDSPLGFEGLKPAVCEKILCVHSHESYGLGLDVLGVIRSNPKLVDLLISFAYVAANSGSRHGGDKGNTSCLDPFPDTVEVKLAGVNYAFLTNGQRNPNLVREVLGLMPSVPEMAEYTDIKQLKVHLDGLHALALPLLQWILSSARCHLAPMPADKMIPQLQSNMTNQFVLVSNPPERELKYRQARYNIASQTNSTGSFFLYHGSAVHNWHSILRVGLKNFSNTKRMTHGAAYGPGIYFAKNSGTSMGYAAAGGWWPKSSISSTNVSCMAICEILNDKSGFKDHNNNIVTVQNEDLVTTRFFLVMAGGAHGAIKDVRAEQLNLPSDLYT